MYRTILAATLLASSLIAQAPSADRDVVHGALPGTLRYNVTFAERPFDCAALQQAIRGGADATAVARIVADLDARAAAHQQPFAKAIAALGGRIERRFWLINACTIDVAPAQLAAVWALPGVAHVDPDRVLEGTILVATNAANHNADAVQAQGIRGEGWGIAIIDSGQDANMGTSGRPHRTYYRRGNLSDLTGGGIGGSRLLANVQMGVLSADNVDPHGVGVMGIAAGEVWSNPAADRGHASDARIVGYSMCDFLFNGGCGTSDATEAASWQQAVADKVRYNLVAANMSFSGSPSPIAISQQAIDAAAVIGDILPVCAAGNSGSITAQSSSCANGLSVAMVEVNTRHLSAASSHGPITGDLLRFFPDIAACGFVITMPQRENEALTWQAGGTSMASPQVCGAAVLMKCAAPLLSALELKAALLASTEDISAQNPTESRNGYGLGFLRDDRAVALVQRPDAVLSGALNSTTTPVTVPLAVTAGVPVTVVLAFHRHVLGSTAWSNFALRVLDGTTVVAQSDDPRNLYERVTFTPANTSTLTVEVSASSLEIATVPWSLATTAAFAGLGTPANWTPGGEGCPGSRGRPSLFPTSRPRLGGSLDMRLAYGTPSSLALFAIGFDNTQWNGLPLPLDLTAQGAPGCALRMSPDSIRAAFTDADGTVALGYGIPAVPAFAGLVLHQQVFALEPTANALGLVVSNSGSFRVGDF